MHGSPWSQTSLPATKQFRRPEHPTQTDRPCAFDNRARRFAQEPWSWETSAGAHCWTVAAVRDVMGDGCGRTAATGAGLDAGTRRAVSGRALSRGARPPWFRRVARSALRSFRRAVAPPCWTSMRRGRKCRPRPRSGCSAARTCGATNGTSPRSTRRRRPSSARPAGTAISTYRLLAGRASQARRLLQRVLPAARPRGMPRRNAGVREGPFRDGRPAPIARPQAVRRRRHRKARGAHAAPRASAAASPHLPRAGAHGRRVVGGLRPARGRRRDARRAGPQPVRQRAARAMAAANDGLSIDRGGRPFALDRAANNRLSGLENDVRSGGAGGVARVPRSDGKPPYGNHGRAVLHRPAASTKEGRGRAASFSSSTIRCCSRSRSPRRSAPCSACRQATANLVAAIAAHEDLTAYAERVGISMNTVRYHLKTAYARTGVRRQSELVRLVIAALRDLTDHQGLRA